MAEKPGSCVGAGSTTEPSKIHDCSSKRRPQIWVCLRILVKNTENLTDGAKILAWRRLQVAMTLVPPQLPRPHHRLV
jgi:hypothetical protein